MGLTDDSSSVAICPVKEDHHMLSDPHFLNNAFCHLIAGLSKRSFGVETAPEAPQIVPAESAPSHVFVLFGASGDLAKKEIYPALWWLFREGLLPKNTRILGCDRANTTMQKIRESFEARCRMRTEDDAHRFEQFINLCTFLSCQSDTETGMLMLKNAIESVEQSAALGMPANRFFYLALPPAIFQPVTRLIRRHCVGTDKRTWSRVVVEKPFGYDYSSALELSAHLSALFSPEHVFRMDHFLGKQMVHNLLATRFGNRFLANTWSRADISSVTIVLNEDFGAEGRASYFDKSGMIRDVVQNHLMQMLSLVAMEEPASLEAEHIANEKVRVLKAIRPVRAEEVVLGQYIASPDAADGRQRLGYLDDPAVPSNSTTETFALCVLWVDNERWRDVPFFVRAGKGLNELRTEIRIQYKALASGLNLFPSTSVERNELVIQMLPEEAVYMNVLSASPSFGMNLVHSKVHLFNTNNCASLPDAYERLLLDVFDGRQNRFVRSDELWEAWRIFTPLLDRIARKRVQPQPYFYGSAGPVASNLLMERHGFVFQGKHSEEEVKRK